MLHPFRARLLEYYTDLVNATSRREVALLLRKWPCKTPPEFKEIENLFLKLEARVVKDSALLGPLTPVRDDPVKSDAPADPWDHLLADPLAPDLVSSRGNWTVALKAADAEVKRLRGVILQGAVAEMDKRQAAREPEKSSGEFPAELKVAIERHNQWMDEQIARDKAKIDKLTQDQEDLCRLRDAEIMRVIQTVRDVGNRPTAHALLLLARRAGVRGSHQDLREPEPHSMIGSVARFLREHASNPESKPFRAPWCVFTYGASGVLLLCGSVATREAAHQVRREVEQEHGWATMVDVCFYGCRVEETPK